MNGPRLMLAAFVIVLASRAAAAGEATQPSKTAALVPQTLCPVDGDEIDKQYGLNYKRKRIYFCSEACATGFQADQPFYYGRLVSAGVALEPIAKRKPTPGLKIRRTRSYSSKRRSYSGRSWWYGRDQWYGRPYSVGLYPYPHGLYYHAPPYQYHHYRGHRYARRYCR